MTKKVLISLVVLLIVGTVGVGMYVFWPRMTHTPASATHAATTTQTVVTTTTTSVPSQTAAATTTTSHPGMKLYRNDQYGFEFWYPQEWELLINSEHSPYSKFNLETNIPNTPAYAFGINVATNNFMQNATQTELNMGATVSTTTIDGKGYASYTFPFEGFTETDIDIPLGLYTMAIMVYPKQIKDLNQILGSFRFFSTATARMTSQVATTTTTSQTAVSAQSLMGTYGTGYSFDLLTLTGGESIMPGDTYAIKWHYDSSILYDTNIVHLCLLGLSGTTTIGHQFVPAKPAYNDPVCSYATGDLSGSYLIATTTITSGQYQWTVPADIAQRFVLPQTLVKLELVSLEDQTGTKELGMSSTTLAAEGYGWDGMVGLSMSATPLSIRE